MYKRKPLGEKGMKSITQQKKQKQTLKERKEIEEIKHIREKKEKQNKTKQKAIKKMGETMKKYSGLMKMINKTMNEKELKVLKEHKKELDKEYNKYFNIVQKFS